MQKPTSTSPQGTHFRANFPEKQQQSAPSVEKTVHISLISLSDSNFPPCNADFDPCNSQLPPVQSTPFRPSIFPIFVHFYTHIFCDN